MLYSDSYETAGTSRLLTRRVFNHKLKEAQTSVAEVTWEPIYLSSKKGRGRKVFQLSFAPMQAKLSDDALKSLRDGLATCTSHRGLSPEARRALSVICGVARENSWPPEQLLILVKEVCYTSPEITHLTTTSEREAFVSTIVSGCIQEYYSPRAD